MPVDIAPNLKKLPSVIWWLLAKRKPLTLLSDAPARAHGVNPIAALMVTSFLACLGAMAFIQMLGMSVLAGNLDPYESRIAVVARGLGEATLEAATALTARQSTPLALGFLPTWALAVLFSLLVAALATPFLNRRDKADTPRSALIWAISGPLFIVGAAAFLGALGIYGFSFLSTEADRIIVQHNDRIFYVFMACLLVALLLSAFARYKGVWIHKSRWDWLSDEVFSSLPALVAILLCIWIPPRIAAHFETQIEARLLDACDFGRNRCTVALTLHDAASYELLDNFRIRATVVEPGATGSATRIVDVAATWVKPTASNAAPILLVRDQLIYAQFEFKPVKVCPGLSPALEPTVYMSSAAEIHFQGQVIGSDGKAVELHRVATIEHVLPGLFTKTLLSNCPSPKKPVGPT